MEHGKAAYRRPARFYLCQYFFVRHSLPTRTRVFHRIIKPLLGNGLEQMDLEKRRRLPFVANISGGI